MRKVFKYCFVFLSVLFAGQTHAQYFSRTYSLLAQTPGYINSIQVLDDTIYAICQINDTVPPYYPIALFDKFDKYGSLLSQAPFSIPGRTNIGANFNNLIRTNDGGFAFGGYTQGTTQTQNALLLLKYDRYGNFQWYKEIPDTNYLGVFCAAFLQDSFSNYYFTGEAQQESTNQNIDTYIAKTDSSGNLIYFRDFLDTISYDIEVGLGLCVNKKGNIVLSGQHGYEDPNDLSTSWLFSLNYELDTAGNIIRKVLGTDSSGTGGGVIFQTNDGGYISGQESICYLSTTYGKTIGSISKLDSNFQVIWTINAGPCSEYTLFEALSPSPDGNYIAVGDWYDDTDTAQTHINGWIMKYSASGQVIWSKLYRGVTSNGTNGDDNGLYSIGFLSDSSIICGGQALNYDGTISPQQRGWLLHLDTAGCLPDSSSCGLPDGIVNILPPPMGNVKVYPNPSGSGVWNIETTEEYTGSRINMSDVSGRIVYSNVINEINIQINGENLAAGVYALHIYNSTVSSSCWLVK